MKKWIALSLALCLGVSALTGCSASSGTQTETAAEQAAESSTETQKASEANETPEETIESFADAPTEPAPAEQKEAGQEENIPEKIVFTYVTSPLNVPTIIERDQNIFYEMFGAMGIETDYAEITSGADQTQALASGDVQVLYAVGATSVILSAANGADIKVLNMYSRSPKAFCMYSRDDSLTSPESLKGKTIAGPTGTNLHELLVAYLATGGLTLDDVDYVNMSIPDAKAALDGGSLDVALIAGATAYQAAQQGYHLVADGEGLIQAIIAVAVTQEFYDTYPSVIETLIDAQEEISQYMQTYPQETMETVAQALDLDVEAVEEMYAYYDFSLSITPPDITGFQKTADFMYESGMIEDALDVNTLFLN